MAYRSMAAWRTGLVLLAAAGALAGTASRAAAQYYYDEDHPYPPAEVYGYGPRYDGGYGYRPDDGYGYRPAPRPRAPAAVTPDTIGRIAFERYGLVRIDRLIRSADAYIVDGARADGRRQRLVLDAYAGELVRRQALPARQNPDVARTDPREPARSRNPQKPPERPATLKGQADGQAVTVPPAPPLTAPVAPVPEKPVPASPVEASAPAKQSPPASGAPPAPSSGTSDPQTSAPKPKLVNPDDVRAPQWSKPGTPQDAGSAQPNAGTLPPPTAAAPPAPSPTAPVVTPAPVTIPPVQGQDSGSAQSKPDVVIPPVTPLD